MESKTPLLNPFLNHLVIENILKYTHRPNDLKSLRLLCHDWNDLVSSKLMQVSSVNMNSERKMRHYLQDFSFSSTASSNTDTDSGSPPPPLPAPALSPPHKNFHLKVLQSLESRESALFLDFILQSADELHLSKCVMSSGEILQILNKGRNLKALSFNEVLVDETASGGGGGGGDDDGHGQGQSDTKTESSQELPHTATETFLLNRLEVTTCDEGDLFPWSDLFQRTNLQALHAQLKSSLQLSSLLESLLNHPQALQEFSSFLIDFDMAQLNLLSCLEPPLKILDLSISSDVHSSIIENLLRTPSLKKNLENLKLFHETEEELNTLVLPPLDNLKSLELMGDPVPSSIFSNISKSCGNLRHLNLSQIIMSPSSSSKKPKEDFGSGSGSDGNLGNLNFSHEKLMSLSIEEGFLSTDVLTKIAKLFPKLRKLCLFLNDKNIGVLFKECLYGSLEEIIVLGTELTDLGVIGVSPNGRSCIGDCKKLRKFSLYPQPQQRITDMSIYHGLAHVKELMSVELPETVITNEGLKFLIRAKPNLVKLSAKIAIHPRTGEHSLRSTKYQILD